VHSTRSHKW